MEFFHKKTNFPFMATRKVWYTLSIVLMIVSFASFFVRGLNFAIDFTGGVSVEANFPKQVDVEAVRKAVIAAGFHEPQVSYLGTLARRGDRPAVHRPDRRADRGRCSRLRSSKIDPGVKITSLEVVGPQVGDELRYVRHCVAGA